MPNELTAKQKRFCHEYIIDNNGTQAAIRAKYSRKTAQEQSSRLLSNVKVKDYIKSISKPIVEDLKISAERVLKGIAELAFAGSTESVKVQGLKMLGEHLKLFTQLHESTLTYTKMENVKMKKKDGKAEEIILDIGEPIEEKE